MLLISCVVLVRLSCWGFQVLGACFRGWYSCYVVGYVVSVEWVLVGVSFSWAVNLSGLEVRVDFRIGVGLTFLSAVLFPGC